ncbi:E3 ubiquitin-protein ligase TTC3-like isoform X8 [Bacillus rossius redtenbacheri]|uniref:E3 ubiquitin-protein ligase TTC3-like isoform X8 n=1 Tax=Bacillus rossius redtenbacheri TaxID=93214 RepID=UPI002FDEF868
MKMDGEGAVERARKEGNYFFKQKQYEAAITSYKKGLVVEKDNVLLLSNLAQVYLVMGQYTEAEVMAARAITLDPAWYKCYNRAAISAENTGHIDKACDYLKKGIEVMERFDASKKRETSAELDHFKKELARMEEKRFRIKGMSSAQQPCGLVVDSDEDSEDYDVDSDTHSVSSVSARPFGKDTLTRADSLGKVNMAYAGNSVDRSRSASVPPAPLAPAVSSKKKTEVQAPRGKSAILNTKEKKRNKKKSGPITMEDLEADPFISFLSTASLVPDDKVEREKFFHMKKKEMKTLLLEGSQALEADVFMVAVEKFHTVYDNLMEFSYQDLGLKEMEVIVVKYLLCFSWVSLTIYEDIIQAIKMLQELENSHSSKFPAIYYILGLAFYRLNRFKSAAMYVEKGLEFITKNLRLCAYPYPGTVSKPIKETTPKGFETALTELLKNCRTHHQPNAVCRYEDCRKLSQHIEPSELIFYNDPDFNGFIVVICEEKCRIEYHVHCWKDFKESKSFQKVTDKDMLGQNCPTKDCVTKKNEHSLIVRIEVMGENAVIKTSLDWQRSGDTIRDGRTNKRKHLNSESLWEKQKQRSCQEKSKEREHESLREQRRQERYRKSDLELDQENNQNNLKQENQTENLKLTNKNEAVEKHNMPKSRKDQQVDEFLKDTYKPKSLVCKGVKIITVKNAEDKIVLSDQKTQTEHSVMMCKDEVGISQESLYDIESEYIENEDYEVDVGIQMNLHDEDCGSDLTEEALLSMYDAERSEPDRTKELFMWDPSKPFCGFEEVRRPNRFLPESVIECPEDEVKEFICSYIFEYLRSADSQTVQDVDEKWIEDSEELKMDLSRVIDYQPHISELLLISKSFVQLENHFGLAEFVPVMYDMLKEELHESFSFIFSHSEENQDNIDIYNSQEDLSYDEPESNNCNEIKSEVDCNETENIKDETIKMGTKKNFDSDNLRAEVEDCNQVLVDEIDVVEESEMFATDEPQKNRNSLNPDATEFCLSADSSLEVFKMVAAEETNLELCNNSQESDIQSSGEDLLLSGNLPKKWSTEDGMSKMQAEWDPNTIVKKWSTSDEELILTGSVQTTSVPQIDNKFALPDAAFTALADLLTPFSEDRQAIWTGVLQWTASDSLSCAVTCSVLCGSKVKHIKHHAALWPREMIMQLVSHDFVETVGFELLCKLSEIVIFEPAVGEDTNSLAQDLGSNFAGIIINGTSPDVTFIVIIYFHNTHTFVGIALHQCFSILSGLLANMCVQNRLEVETKTIEVGVQADDADYEMKLQNFEEVTKELRMKCDGQEGRLTSLSSTVEALQSESSSLSSQLTAKEDMCAELMGKCSQREGENAKLQETVRNLVNQVQGLESKLHQQGETNKDLESKLKQQRAEKQDLERRLAEMEKKLAEDKNEINLIVKRKELSEKFLCKKVEAVEETNQTLRSELNAKEIEMKQLLNTITEEKKVQSEELTALQQKLAEMEQHRQELITSKDQLKAQEEKFKQQHLNHVQELWNYRFDTVNRAAIMIIECCKGRLDELSQLSAALVACGNSALLAEVNGWLSIWQTCSDEAKRQLEHLKQTYPGLLERAKSGEVVKFPEFDVKFPSQPKNLVEVAIRMNKKLPLLATPLPLLSQNASQFTGNPVYYPPFQNHQMYVPQLSGFAQMPGLNINPSQRQVPVFSGNTVKQPEVEAEANSVDHPKKKPNAASRLMKSVVRQPLAAGKESSMPTTADVVINNSLVELQGLVNEKASSTIASVEPKPAPAEQKPAITSKPPAASELLAAGDSATTVPEQAKPVVHAVPHAGTMVPPAPVAPRPTRAPIKTVTRRPSSSASPSPVNKPPSLLDLKTRMPATQTGKVQQNQKPKSANFQKLLTELRKKYSNKSDEDLEACILVVRERNNNRLTGLPLPTIVTMVGKVLQEQSRKKDGGSMGLDKFGKTAWHLKSAETVQWSKPKDTSDEECTICIEPLGTETTILFCKHSFHTSCIRTWLRNESVCPICRVYTRMVDEFPPLT